MNLTPQQLVAEAREKIREVGVETVSRHLDAGTIFIDVREYAEFEAAHIPGAIHIPRGVLEFKIGDYPALANKSAEILLYCKTGGRSVLATLNLQRMGYSNLSSLAGGFDSWVSHNQSVAKDETNFGG